MEVEAKYKVNAADLDRLATLQAIGHYTLRTLDGERQRNVYYDSADGRLAAARFGLRVRQIGQRSFVTLKGPARIDEHGIHHRAEFEFPGDDPNPAHWPEGPARDLAQALLLGAPLRPLLTIETNRRIIHAARDGQDRVELCLDRGTIYAGKRQAPICELELEVLPAGSVYDLTELAQALRALIKLTPERQSKLERGMLLLQQ
ncbi:CYTH domain-containing protein [Chloroflexus sp.]|uniref:CYTH domain-containing protein n=1 Tax=Chloroflexus sp. TaxID=1904827 RepID=UPI002620D9F0|nr:CYTH domain-containing protein [uncultured Chloroflexus sp.]